MIVVMSENKYGINDVVTFKTEASRIVTHRITKIENETKYLTKGDANRYEDAMMIDRDWVMGKVVQVIPKIGLLANFAKMHWGYLTFFILPFGLIAIYELWLINQ